MKFKYTEANQEKSLYQLSVLSFYPISWKVVADASLVHFAGGQGGKVIVHWAVQCCPGATGVFGGVRGWGSDFWAAGLRDLFSEVANVN